MKKEKKYEYEYGNGTVAGVVDIDKELFPDTCNMKEVRILNQTTFEEYVVGYADDIPIAIIGIPDSVDSKTIKVRKNNQEINFNYVRDDMLRDMEFNIYPYDKKYYNDRLLTLTHDSLLQRRKNRKIMELKRNNKQKIKTK